MKIAISAESTIDLTKELLDEYDIHTTPFTVTLGEKTGLDGEITSEEIINFVTETNKLPKTSAVNAFQFTEHFDKLLKDYDAIIHFSLSSEMSSACSNAKIASEEFKNVYVKDKDKILTSEADDAKKSAALEELNQIQELWKLRAMGTSIGCHNVIRKGTDEHTVKINNYL